MRRRTRIGARRVRDLQRVRDKVLSRRESRRPVGWGRRLGRRAERARPWLQFLADLAALLAKVVR
ncbi:MULTISPECIES: hypothetical protein [unclassified Streptomyces]|uniref:hypothetical protein n=1 Tax=Streptomyces sp. SS1-1 TaxID=2651869 RepID=UPI00124FCA9A|nr:hypothetical protein [Streptomyces sp. SS1-1]KAB2974000.1 hypothetical protein F8R89_19645 [Streptomyces sp. SS1-1]